MQKRHNFILFTILAAVAVAVLAWGCSASHSDTNPGFGGSGGSGSANGPSSGTGEGGCLLNCETTSSTGGGGNNPGGVIVIAPANPSIVVQNGMIPTVALKATLGNLDVTAQVVWTYERPDVGDVKASAFTPTGLVGGTGKLTANLAKATGATTVSVVIKKVVNTGGLSDAQIMALDNAADPDPNGGLNIVYPLPETVFPLGVLAPEVQWNSANPGDFYKLAFSEKYYQYSEYFNTPSPARHTVAEDDWKSIENSGTGAQSDPVMMSLSRFSGGKAYKPDQMALHVAQGRLHGSVYYWELPDQCGNGNGRVLRIKPDSPNVDEFYSPGQCYGCHTVSRDGKTMAATFDNGVPFPQKTIDLSADPAQLGPLQNGLGGTFMAFNDKGDKLLASNDSASNPSGSVLRIADSTNGNILNPNALGTGCGEPAWSPDGKKIAGICNLGGGGWIFDATQGDLTIADVAADGVSVSNTKVIVPKGGGSGRPAYPSFSPGSEWLAFGRPTAGSRSTGNGDLWLASTDGANVKQLAAASNGNQSYNPVFAPLRAGGFFWLVYISRRDYGNEMVGANRQQLWVTAIDDPPSAGDPSHPPFYMRGQEMCGKSENAYYALDPCKAVGADCLSGVDCCNGQCVKDPNTNKYVCGDPPPPGQCSGDGNACKVDADCCNSPTVACIDGFCQVPPPK
jgi:hypothetical protein